MQPQLPVPTDNIYKFSCLFGLVLIVSAIFSFVAMYTSSQESKVRYFEVIIPLESRETRTKAEEDLLALNKKLIEVTKENERVGNAAIVIVFTVGLLLSAYGAKNWYGLIQVRDDRLADLQLRKLELEIEKLKGATVTSAEDQRDKGCPINRAEIRSSDEI